MPGPARVAQVDPRTRIIANDPREQLHVTRRQFPCTSPLNVARRPIWLLLVVAICAVASVMGMATSAHLASSLPNAAATPGSDATPRSVTQVFPVSTVISDIERPGPDIAKNAVPSTIPLANKRVYDSGLLIGSANEKTLEGDARVLASYGVPVLVYVRRSSDSVAESQSFADNLRLQRGVESVAGADDGLVMLLTVDMQSNNTGKVVFSTGEHTLPVNGLDQEALDRIQREDIIPNLRRGNIYDALNISLRHMTYSAQFVPGAVAPTSLRQDMVASLLSVIAPLGTLLLGIASGILWLAPTSLFKRAGLTRRNANKAVILAGLGFAIALMVSAVYARSATGAGCAALAFSILAANGLIGRTHANGMRTLKRSTRVLRVRPRLAFRPHPKPSNSITPSGKAPLPARRRS